MVNLLNSREKGRIKNGMNNSKNKKGAYPKTSPQRVKIKTKRIF